MEPTYTIYRCRDFSRRDAAPAPARLLMILLVTLGGWVLIHRVGTPAAAPNQQAPLRPRYATSVLVLNGNGRSGVASAFVNRLLAHGYRTAYATDAQMTTYARSLILFRGGWAGEAERLAKDFGIHGVAPLEGKPSRYPLVAILGK